MGILPDIFGNDDVSALALFLYTRCHIHSSTEIIQKLIHVDGDAGAVMNSDLQR